VHPCKGPFRGALHGPVRLAGDLARPRKGRRTRTERGAVEEAKETQRRPVRGGLQRPCEGPCEAPCKGPLQGHYEGEAPCEGPRFQGEPCLLARRGICTFQKGHGGGLVQGPVQRAFTRDRAGGPCKGPCKAPYEGPSHETLREALLGAVRGERIARGPFFDRRRRPPTVKGPCEGLVKARPRTLQGIVRGSLQGPFKEASQDTAHSASTAGGQRACPSGLYIYTYFRRRPSKCRLYCPILAIGCGGGSTCPR